MQWLDYLPWRERLAEAIDERLYTVEYLDGLISGGLGQIWTTADAAIVVTIRQYPTGARAVSGIVAGNLHQIENELIPIAEQWGRESGCTLALIEGRPGWVKTMKRHGYEPHTTTVEKDLR